MQKQDRKHAHHSSGAPMCRQQVLIICVCSGCLVLQGSVAERADSPTTKYNEVRSCS
jgi:hypothetical protein